MNIFISKQSPQQRLLLWVFLVTIVLAAILRPALAACKSGPYKLSSPTEQKPDQVEKDWSDALEKHTEKLDCAFKNFESGDYRGYKKFKTKEWDPAFSHDHEIVYQYWLATPNRTSARYRQLHDIFNAWANLNNASIYMQYYLLSGKTEERNQAHNKLNHVKSTLATLSKKRRRGKSITLENNSAHRNKPYRKPSPVWVWQYS